MRRPTSLQFYISGSSMKGFGSDNHAGVHPKLMSALELANKDHAPSYGTDDFSAKAIQKFKLHFGDHTEVFFVFNGTASNVLSLSFLTKRHESVFCSESSHLNIDECGAPEFFAAKLIPVPDIMGKIQLKDLEMRLIRKGDQHYSQTRVVSITQPTELGTCYSLDEIKSICRWAHENNLYVHMDGARITNALTHLNCSFKQMCTETGVDVVSFGGTKNGLMMGEAILVLNSELATTSREELKYIRKQAAQLPSKTRFIAAQFDSYLSNSLYLEIAQHSCSMAEYLQKELTKIPEVKISYARQSNAVFAVFPKKILKKLRQNYFFYIWNEETFECRLMTSWDTKPSEIEGFVSLVKELLVSVKEPISLEE